MNLHTDPSTPTPLAIEQRQRRDRRQLHRLFLDRHLAQQFIRALKCFLVTER